MCGLILGSGVQRHSCEQYEEPLPCYISSTAWQCLFLTAPQQYISSNSTIQPCGDIVPVLTVPFLSLVKPSYRLLCVCVLYICMYISMRRYICMTVHVWYTCLHVCGAHMCIGVYVNMYIWVWKPEVDAGSVTTLHIVCLGKVSQLNPEPIGLASQSVYSRVSLSLPPMCWDYTTPICHGDLNVSPLFLHSKWFTHWVVFPPQVLTPFLLCK